MNEMPKDPMILLSFVNTKLRDFSPSLEAFCLEYQVSQEEIIEKLAFVDFEYDAENNRFV